MRDYPQFSWRTIRQTSPVSQPRWLTLCPGGAISRGHQSAIAADEHGNVPDEGIHVHQATVSSPATPGRPSPPDHLTALASVARRRDIAGTAPATYTG